MAVEVQNEMDLTLPVSEDELKRWATDTLNQLNEDGGICICIVDEKTMSNLNGQYRKQHKPTNILSFPSELPKEIQEELNILGDMVICPTVLLDEAEQLNKPLKDHWAHICVHGVLHLLGYDHIKEDEAKKMQAAEINLLAKLNIPNPYSETEGANIEH